ncbi:MAG: efflux RND transporter periplasmic adaptor subunit [Deltaproteobacteria bacterium]|nr:efflux RND transporter periplasmic adaptor subunit [Deltaproteobacteria bacterium]
MNHRTLELLPIILLSCGRPEAATPTQKSKPVVDLVKVDTAAVETRKMPKYLTLTGSVLADRSSEIAANVSGHVTATYVERGQPVKAGQIIAVVDAKAASFQVAAAIAQSKAAESQVALARQDCARAEMLFKEGALPKSEYDRQTTQCSAQLYNANAIQAQADLAGKLAGDTEIRAPMDGLIGERYINVGEYVQPSSRVASLYSINPVRINISVPESAVRLVREGQTLDVRVSAYPDRTFPAVVRLLGPALRPATRDLIVEAFAKNEERKLMPGMFATVSLVVGEADEPTVPSAAVRSDGIVKRIFLAREGAAFEMVVRTGVEKDGRIAVLEPLSDKDRVIVSPPPGLHDGHPIQ